MTVAAAGGSTLTGQVSSWFLLQSVSQLFQGQSDLGIPEYCLDFKAYLKLLEQLGEGLHWQLVQKLQKVTATGLQDWHSC